MQHFFFDTNYSIQINLYIIILFVLWALTQIGGSTLRQLKYQSRKHDGIVFIVCLTLALSMGFRNPWGNFADTANYTKSYYMALDEIIQKGSINFTTEGEWGWHTLVKLFTFGGLHITLFYLTISFLYHFLIYLGVSRIFKSQLAIAFAFVIIDFSFISFSFNGLRNGTGCAFCILGLSYIMQQTKRERIIGFMIMLIGTTFHKSCTLPCVCAFATIFNNDTKLYLKFWISSALISFVAGGAISNLFMGLGFDDRLDSYQADADNYEAQGFKTGFRFDFLLYSAVPIFLAYKAYVIKGIRDAKYQTLINVYLLANSFWIMVIRASYSNRFAYLSWFIYGVVVAYPLLNFQIFNEHTKRLTQILGGLTVFYIYFYWRLL